MQTHVASYVWGFFLMTACPSYAEPRSGNQVAGPWETLESEELIFRVRPTDPLNLLSRTRRCKVITIASACTLSERCIAQSVEPAQQ